MRDYGGPVDKIIICALWKFIQGSTLYIIHAKQTLQADN